MTAKKSKQSVTEWQIKTNTMLEKAKSTIKDVNDIKNDFINGNEDTPPLSKLKTQIKSINDFYESKKIEEIEEQYELLIDSEESIKKKLEEEIKTLNGKLDELINHYESFEEFNKKIFGFEEELDEVDETTGNKKIRYIKGYNDKFSDALENLKTLRKDKEKELEELYSKYDKKITSLLPGALTAGLAKAYTDTSTAYERKALCSQVFFVLFVIMIIIIGLLNIGFTDLITEDYSTNYLIKTLRVIPTYNTLFYVMAPLIWLAIVFQKRSKTYIRLHAEYQHKANLCKTFDGLKREASDQNDNKLVEALLTSMIASSADNPSSHIGKDTSENFVNDLIESLFDKIKSIVNK